MIRWILLVVIALLTAGNIYGLCIPPFWDIRTAACAMGAIYGFNLICETWRDIQYARELAEGKK